MFIKLEDALELVLELARQSVLDEDQADSPDLENERQRQIEACNVVEDHITNHYAKD